MEFKKIQISKAGTLNVTYKDDYDNIIQLNGANIVHKDLKEAMQALVPHFALLTEQREAFMATLTELREQKITDAKDNIAKRLTVECLNFSNGRNNVAITGSRILSKTGVITFTSPSVNMTEDDYEYASELALDIDAVIFEAKAYIEEKKWAAKEASIKFEDIDPFEVEAGEVPDAGKQAKKKKTRKTKVA